jgi:hypothetical protein
MDQQTLTRRAGGLMAAMAALALAAAPAAASAQTTTSTKSTPTSRSAQISTSATVQSIDGPGRHITVKLPSGETRVLKVPPAFKRFGELKVGDKIKATYYAEVAFSISQPGKPLPENTDTVVAARATDSETPAGLVASRAVITGAVLAIDVPGSKVKVVNPKGGEVHELDVTTPEGKAFLAKLKVGDKVTAQVNEALLISVDRE